MDAVVRVRTVVAFGAAVASAVAGTVIVTQAWGVEAAPGASESTVVMVSPRRVLDTRDAFDVGLPGPFVSPVSQKLTVTGTVETTTGDAVVVPTGATGVLLNVTAVNTTANGFISVRPGNATGAPATSSLNITAGVTVPNAVTVALPTSGDNAGQIDITFDALGVPGPRTDILVDVVGYSTSTGLQELVAAVEAKAPAEETVLFDGRGMVGVGDFQRGTTNGCTVNLNARSGTLPLEIPTGATILAVSAVVYDGSGTNVHTARLNRVTTGPVNEFSETIATATGGAGQIVMVTHDLTPATPEIVDPGERFRLDHDDGVNSFGDGLCYVSVRYRQSTGAASLAEALPPAGGEGAPPACESTEACRVEIP